MEVLQFLKYTYRQEHLDLTCGLMTSEQDMLDADTPLASTEEVRELLINGQIDQLAQLLNMKFD